MRQVFRKADVWLLAVVLELRFVCVRSEGENGEEEREKNVFHGVVVFCPDKAYRDKLISRLLFTLPNRAADSYPRLLIGTCFDF